ncbi:hypothetical protein OSB04_001489 [Centaurea solstitialis]|uniref:Myb-like domain-containing protein n=1 Tax=Centaurea solstitialis TaxID=347529 RepID=A0AA38UA18_9ASTR|nr:hypothetical protein OSB04_001489 [Centaurea solstitialis]
MDPHGTPLRFETYQPNQPNQPYHQPNQPYHLPNLAYHPPNIASDYWMYAHLLSQHPPPPPPPSQHSGFHQPTAFHQPTGSHQATVRANRPVRTKTRRREGGHYKTSNTLPTTMTTNLYPKRNLCRRHHRHHHHRHHHHHHKKNKRGRKGKSAATEADTSGTHTGKAKCRPWTLNEEVELAKAWVEVSEDPAIGNYKKRDNYWTSIKTSFDKRMNYDRKVWSGDAILTKVRMLIASVSKFACVYNNVSNSRVRPGHHDGPTKHMRAENKRSRTTETPIDSPNESDARTNFVNLDADSPSHPECTRPMGRNAARRAASSSTATASSEAVSMVATELGSLATTNSRLIDAISQRQRSIDYKIYMKPHRGLEGLELEATLEEKERLREQWGFQKYY